MFNQKEAEVFVRDVFENILANGKIDLLKKKYASDFQGHYLDEIFYLDSLEKKIHEINEGKSEYFYRVGEVNISGEFINITCATVHIDKTTNIVHQSKQVINWLIQDKKIKESWVIIDQENASYKLIGLDRVPALDTSEMFTQAQAKEFIEKRNKDIFIDGKLGLLNNYYTTDFIGHSSDQVFDLEDIKKRVRTINKSMKNFKAEIQSVMVSGNLITTSGKFTFINKATNSLYEVLQFNTFLIENRKIKESWMILDKDSTYKEMRDINLINYESILLPYEINQKNKEEFLKTLDTVLNTDQFRYIRISPTEKECLYYYLNGFSAKETAALIKLSFRTVETYILQIKEKFASTNRLDLRKKLFPESNS